MHSDERVKNTKPDSSISAMHESGFFVQGGCNLHCLRSEWTHGLLFERRWCFLLGNHVSERHVPFGSSVHKFVSNFRRAVAFVHQIVLNVLGFRKAQCSVERASTWVINVEG